jgi:hypothetical protein
MVESSAANYVKEGIELLTTTVQLQKEEHGADDGQQLEVGLSSCDLLLPGIPRKSGIEVLVSIVVFGPVVRIQW